MDNKNMKRISNIMYTLAAVSVLGTYVTLHAANVIDKDLSNKNLTYTSEEREEAENNRRGLIDAGCYTMGTTVLFGASGAILSRLGKDNDMEK
ncbi:MAG: hypothetical protein E7361_01865 [Clostridiales bacterium]|nr:hypothetical protein [Clostridiales bacterium]